MLKDEFYITSPSGAIAEMKRQAANTHIMFTLHHVIGKETKVLWGTACNIWIFDKQVDDWIRLYNSPEIFYEGRKYVQLAGALLKDLQKELATALGKDK